MKLYFYDLDGTLNKLNNTYDFIEKYHQWKKNRIRLYFSRVFSYLLNFLPVNFYTKRKISIMFYFFGENIQDLKKFYFKKYRKVFFKNLTFLGNKIYLNRNKYSENFFLVTGCTEIPAKYIAKDLGFKKEKVFFTKFKISNGKVVGILMDSFGERKKIFIDNLKNKKNKKNKFIYFTDDLENEKDLFNYFDEVYYVNHEKCVKIK